MYFKKLNAWKIERPKTGRMYYARKRSKEGGVFYGGKNSVPGPAGSKLRSGSRYVALGMALNCPLLHLLKLTARDRKVPGGRVLDL